MILLEIEDGVPLFYLVSSTSSLSSLLVVFAMEVSDGSQKSFRNLRTTRGHSRAATDRRQDTLSSDTSWSNSRVSLLGLVAEFVRAMRAPEESIRKK